LKIVGEKMCENLGALWWYEGEVLNPQNNTNWRMLRENLSTGQREWGGKEKRLSGVGEGGTNIP